MENPLQLHRSRGKRSLGHLSIRNKIQLGFLLLTLAVGIQFSIYVFQLSEGVAVSVGRPPGVEAFLPIGGLAGWKFFLSTGVWDPVHPAAMVILGFAALISICFRKSFCAWVCPVGTLSEWLWKVGKRMFGKNIDPPIWIDFPMRGLKYLLLGFFLCAVLAMDTGSLARFLESPYYKVVDVKMLFFFTRLSLLSAVVLTVLTIGSILIRNFWCRYICPYGALMGMLARLSPTRIARRPEACPGCRQCANACPSRLPVDRSSRITSPECSGCMDCVLACPSPDALALKSAGFPRRPWSAAALGSVVILLFVSVVFAAEATGHWQSHLTTDEVRFWVQRIESPQLVHPGVARQRSRIYHHQPDSRLW